MKGRVLWVLEKVLKVPALPLSTRTHGETCAPGAVQVANGQLGPGRNFLLPGMIGLWRTVFCYSNYRVWGFSLDHLTTGHLISASGMG